MYSAVPVNRVLTATLPFGNQGKGESFPIKHIFSGTITRRGNYTTSILKTTGNEAPVVFRFLRTAAPANPAKPVGTGRMKPGYLADMVILNKDIFTVDPVEIRDMYVELTVMDEKIVYRR